MNKLMKTLSQALALLVCAAPAWALYKVVGPDGKVTYTDRPPTDTSARVQSFGSGGVPNAGNDIGLPVELRQVASKYPVTLFTAADCAPCDAARSLLQQRGIPYAEKRVTTEDDALALERLIGARSLPGATVGAQILRGLNAPDWTTYLDAAGYPRESRLPRNWQPPAVTPLVAAREAAPAATPAARPAAPAPGEQPAPGSIKF